jgi:diaminohydroxyphosphoribosylaminopyrimidine deaminase/5-amino-6-(5-phosphoribosylamino)uracil reductase
MTADEKYMQRCLQLAKNGLGTTYPNPLVGSVIVKDDQIIGEGWHYQSGKPHAEVNAVQAAINARHTDKDLSESTIYVNLEPCSHTGRTPPCADMIIKHGFKRVVVGTLDPHMKVAGKGVERIRNAGIEVVVGVLENECNELNKRFFTYHKKQRPYIILKWAQSEDSFIAPLEKDSKRPVWLSNIYSRQLGHRLRAEEQAILVGYNTYTDDTPSLTARDWYGSQPERYVWSTRPLNKSIESFKWLETTEPNEVIQSLYDDGVQSVIIEGGAKTIQRFIETALWDEAQVFMATEVRLGNGIEAPNLPSVAMLKSRQEIENDILKIYRAK